MTNPSSSALFCVHREILSGKEFMKRYMLLADFKLKLRTESVPVYVRSRGYRGDVARLQENRVCDTDWLFALHNLLRR